MGEAEVHALTNRRYGRDWMLTALKRTEEELGPDHTGSWGGLESGMINGKLSVPVGGPGRRVEHVRESR